MGIRWPRDVRHRSRFCDFVARRQNLVDDACSRNRLPIHGNYKTYRLDCSRIWCRVQHSHHICGNFWESENVGRWAPFRHHCSACCMLPVLYGLAKITYQFEGTDPDSHCCKSRNGSYLWKYHSEIHLNVFGILRPSRVASSPRPQASFNSGHLYFQYRQQCEV